MDKGNLPHGCIMTGPDDIVLLEGENTVVTDQNSIAHAEINLIRRLSSEVDLHFLEHCTLYATIEPCAMCAGAIFWSGIGHVVYAMGRERYHRNLGLCDPAYRLDISAREILEKGGRSISLLGPLLEQEAIDCYEKWNAAKR